MPNWARARFQLVGNALNLPTGLAAANQEKISKRRQFGNIQQNQIQRLQLKGLTSAKQGFFPAASRRRRFDVFFPFHHFHAMCSPTLHPPS